MIMDTIKINKGKTQMVAHRGVSGIETENTAASFLAAANRSYYGIETDVRQTADGKFVCIHDNQTGRVSTVDLNVNDSTYAELLTAKYNDNSHGAGQRADLVMPLMQDYISICKNYGKHSVLELKDPFSISQLEQIVKIIDDLGHLQDTTFISFYPENMYGMRKLLPTQSCQFLCDRMDDEVFKGVISAHVDVDLLYSALNPEKIKMLKDSGIKINCWTVDDKNIAEQLCEWGVDFITSNILE